MMKYYSDRLGAYFHFFVGEPSINNGIILQISVADSAPDYAIFISTLWKNPIVF
jgi:hypothetical protein